MGLERVSDAVWIDSDSYPDQVGLAGIAREMTLCHLLTGILTSCGC